jgi:hypothetical protein
MIFVLDMSVKHVEKFKLIPSLKNPGGKQCHIFTYADIPSGKKMPVSC